MKKLIEEENNQNNFKSKNNAVQIEQQIKEQSGRLKYISNYIKYKWCKSKTLLIFIYKIFQLI